MLDLTAGYLRVSVDDNFIGLAVFDPTQRPLSYTSLSFQEFCKCIRSARKQLTQLYGQPFTDSLFSGNPLDSSAG